MSFTIAIIGRPNVGKSTLFNRLAGKKLAIIDDKPGVTRDWREAQGHLLDMPVTILDTAGLEEAFDDSIEGRMRRQTEEALSRADAVLFMIDGREGLTPADEHFAGWLRRQKKPVVLAVNKCENENAAASGMGEAYALGFGDPVPISSAHGHGIEDLYHAFEPHFPETEEENDDDESIVPDFDVDAIEGDENFDFAELELKDDSDKPIKIAIVGRPNVGKSTLLNSLLQDNRVMTGPEAGITRDAIAVDWEFNDKKIRLVDTAGMRKKAKVNEKIERMSVEDSLRAIRLSQVVIVVIDANMIMEKQDLQIADHILEEGRAMIIAVNKWDTIEDKKEALDELNYKLETSLAQVRNVPTVTISALNGRNLGILMQTVLDTYELWNKRVPTGKMNRWLSARESQHPAPLFEGRPNRLKYITQINVRPPTFSLWLSKPSELPGSYKRYLSNALREDFDLEGVPIRLLLRTSKNPYGNKKK
ncbi:MAG: ribosome biogenesis GTPase Der [Alphaproteobacteria bacterium]|nr:ribosome biogenesis GTPase Der [Alphaproteobacteria bacterium]